MKASRALYNNHLFLSGDTPVFRCDWRRVQWYLSKGLAYFVSHDPPVLRLNFKPKGPGHATDPYFLQEFKNQCVVCGSTERLSHHHIVPKCYRNYFPRDSFDKGKWFYDVLLLCLKCHNQYEKQANGLKREIAGEYGIPVSGVTNLNKERLDLMKAGAALHRHRDKLPPEKRLLFENLIKGYLGKETLEPGDARGVWKAVLDELETTPAAAIIVKGLSDIDQFSIRWRHHFLKTMKPAFMPDYWKADRRVYTEADSVFYS